MAKPPTSVRSIRLPEETWAWLTKQASDRGTTANAIIARLVDEWREEQVSPEFTVPARVKVTETLHPLTVISPTAHFGPIRPKPGSRLKGAKK